MTKRARLLRPATTRAERPARRARRSFVIAGMTLAAVIGTTAAVGPSAAPEEHPAPALRPAAAAVAAPVDRSRTAAEILASREKSAITRAARRAVAQREARAAERRRQAREAAEARRVLANAQADPRSAARVLLAEFGFAASEFECLDALYTSESNWRWNADNPSSSAYGIPQALPGEKMASAGADWATNPVTQIRWGLGYIRDSYGSPCSAWGFKSGNGWY